MFFAVPPYLSLSTVAAIYLIASCGPAPLRAREPRPGAPTLTIATYNIELRSWNEPRTIEAIGAANAEVVCLQESNPEWEAVLRERYIDEYPYQAFAHAPGAAGLGVLSKYPVLDLGAVESPGGWHQGWHIEVAHPARPVGILIVHLRAVFNGNGGPIVSALTVDEDHRREIRTFVSSCEDDLPSLVVGDFNEDPEGEAVHTLEELGFRNALPLYHPGQETWFARSLGGQFGETVDHILFDETLVSLNAWVLRRGQSDHIPVVAMFELTGQGEIGPHH